MKTHRIAPHICWLLIGAASGWALALIVWLLRQTRSNDSWELIVYVYSCMTFACLYSTRKESQVRRFLLGWMTFGAAVAALMGPNSSSSFEHRFAELWTNPFFAFYPTTFAFHATVGGVVGLIWHEVKMRGKEMPVKSLPKKEQDSQN